MILFSIIYKSSASLLTESLTRLIYFLAAIAMYEDRIFLCKKENIHLKKIHVFKDSPIYKYLINKIYDKLAEFPTFHRESNSKSNWNSLVLDVVNYAKNTKKDGLKGV